MSQIYHNIQRIEVGGCCPSGSVYIYNVMQVVIDRFHVATPKRVMHYKIPKGYLQSHSWITVDLHLLSDHSAFRGCVVGDFDPDDFDCDDFVCDLCGTFPCFTRDCADNLPICHFKIIVQNPIMYSDPWVWGDPFPATFVGANVELMIENAIPSSYSKQLLNYDDSVWIYRFITKCLKRKVYHPAC